MKPALALLLTATLWIGCSDDDGGGNLNTLDCPEGHLPRGAACLPSFDDCPGPAEVARLGGVCQAVGVTACASGFASDGEGGCSPILPAQACPVGSIEVLGQPECQPIGVTACASSFASDGEGGCEPVLPAEPCLPGTMEILGQPECQPIGDCGTGTWGNLTLDAQTVFVDASADASGSDGSQAHPYPGLEAALAAVPAGGQVALAAGTYAANVVLDRPVRLSGRCPSRVTLIGQDQPAIDIGTSGSGSRIQGVTLTGNAEALQVIAATGVEVRAVEVREARGRAAIVAIRSELWLDRVVLGANQRVGLLAEATEATLTDCVIRDTQPESGSRGRGLAAQCDLDGAGCGRVEIQRSLITRNHEFGVILFGADATIRDSVVSDTLPNSSLGRGNGVDAECDAEVSVCGSLHVDGSVITGNTEYGVALSGAAVTITGSVVRDTRPTATGALGWGIFQQCHFQGLGCGSLELTRSTVRGNRGVALTLWGVDGVIAGSVIAETSGDTEGNPGRGVEATCHALTAHCGTLTVLGSQITGNLDAGIHLSGVAAEVVGSVVSNQGTGAELSGRGISGICDPQGNGCGALAVRSSLVSRNHEAGIAVAGPETVITGSVVQGTLPNEQGNEGRGINAQCSDTEPACGSLTVTGSVIADNSDHGLFVAGPDVTVTDTVVHSTTPVGTHSVGRGLEVICYGDSGVCSTVTLTGDVFTSNTDVAVALIGATATMTGCLVRDTRPNGEGAFGRGVIAQCDPFTGVCGQLEIATSLVDRNETNGIFAAAVPMVLRGVTVRETRQNLTGRFGGDDGQGVFAMCDPLLLRCATLELTGCVVRSSFVAGIGVQSVSGRVESSVVDLVEPRLKDGFYGYGVQVEGVSDEAPVTFHITRSLIQSADLAGALYATASGTISRSVITDAEFSVVWSTPDLAPEVTADNILAGTAVSEACLQTALEPAPAPQPVAPSAP
jgi:hypothetical protein